MINLNKREANIVCLKWGDKKYGPEYVNKLYKAFKRHTTISFTFHCFTEKPQGIINGIEVHSLPNNKLEGWWNKLWLFSKEMPLTGRLFFVDLDTLIVGNVDNLISHDKGFVVLRDFYHARRTPTAAHMGSGLLSFEAHKHHRIWDSFVKNPSQNQRGYGHGDQGWIQHVQKERKYWQDLYQNQVVSYKLHCKGGPPKDARIICYHGRPSIPESISKTTKAQGTFKPAPWVKDHWKD